MVDRPQRLEFHEVADWPALAWLARCPKSSPVVSVYHGSRVEVRDDWFCEAVWDGPFPQGDLDQTDIIAGSGARLREGALVFVSSGSTVDRLQSLETPEAAWVSNSLACLLATTDATFDPSFSGQARQLMSIVAGIDRYRRFFPTSRGPVQLTYFDNLAWDGRELTLKPKPGEGRDFSTFDRYHAFLQASLQAMAGNMADAARKYPYEFLSTASSGYDSATVTVLAQQAGCTQVLSAEHARSGESDSGEPLARLLGMTSISMARDAWRSSGLPEVPFIAADAHGGDVFFKGAEPVLTGKVLLTGYNGGRIWGKAIHRDESIGRGDHSGVSLTEYRLVVGMIHCPPTFWGVRQIADVNAISLSPEMAPWDVPRDYSRPICRRIVEGAGVPREIFGIKKRASWVTMVKNIGFLSEDSMQSYLGWLRANRAQWLRRGRMPPLLSLDVDRLDLAWRLKLRRAINSQTGWKRKALQRSGLWRILGRLHDTPPRLRQYLFPWAVEHYRSTYRRPFEG